MVDLTAKEEQIVSDFKKQKGELTPDKYKDGVWVSQDNNLLLLHAEDDNHGEFTDNVECLGTPPESIEWGSESNIEVLKACIGNKEYVYREDLVKETLNFFNLSQVTENLIKIDPSGSETSPMLLHSPDTRLVMFIPPFVPTFP